MYWLDDDTLSGGKRHYLGNLIILFPSTTPVTNGNHECSFVLMFIHPNTYFYWNRSMHIIEFSELDNY